MSLVVVSFIINSYCYSVQGWLSCRPAFTEVLIYCVRHTEGVTILEHQVRSGSPFGKTFTMELQVLGLNLTFFRLTHFCRENFVSFTKHPFYSRRYMIIWCQKHVSQAGISNCIPQYSVGCNYLFLPEIPTPGTKVIISCSMFLVGILYIIGIDTKIEVIVVSPTTWEAHHSPRAKPEGCGELPRSLVTPQWPKSRYQFRFYHDAPKHIKFMQIRVCISRKSLIKLLQISHHGKHGHRPLSQQLP